MRKIPQKINFAKSVEPLLSDLEEQLKILSTLLLDVTTGFLSLLCCTTTAESASVMENFRENVLSLHNEFTAVMDGCVRHKEMLIQMWERGLREQMLVLKKG